MIFRKRNKFIFWVLVFFLIFNGIIFSGFGGASIIRHHSIGYLHFLRLFFPLLSVWLCFNVIPQSTKLDSEGLSVVYFLFDKEYKVYRFMRWELMDSINYNWPFINIVGMTEKGERNLIGLNVFQENYEEIIPLVLERNKNITVDYGVKKLLGI